MWQVKLIIMGVLLMTVGNTYAWGEETPIEENETMNIGLSPYLNSSSPTIPFEYTYEREIMNMPFTMGSYTSNDAIAVCTQYKIYKQIWDGSSYTQVETCNISMETCVNLNYDPVSKTYVLPPNWAEVTSNEYMIKKYFQELINSDSEYCNNWNNSVEVDHPDVFYTTVKIDVEDGNTYWGYIYTSLDDKGERELESDDIDYGFDMEGRGSGGGSGGIYEGINMYGSSGGDTTGMGASFYTIFWCIIPLVFVLSVMKLASRCMK